MDNLASHIEYLIMRHECVVIPSVGAFIATSMPARLNEQTGELLPMRREIIFNEDIRHDDALLASSYAKKDGVSFEEAKRHVADSIRLLKEMLRLDGEVTVGTLGTLRRRSEGNLIFMPLSDAIDHARRIGRLPLTLTLLESADIQKKADSQQPAADTEESALHTAGISEKEPLIQKNLCDARREINRTANDKVYYIIRINKHALRYAAMLIIVVAAVLSIAIPYSHQTPEIDKASVLPIDTMIDSSRNKEIINDSADTGKTVPASAAKPETDSLAEREKEYHLIVATFRTPEEAEYFIKAAKDTAYDLKIVKSKKLCRVSAKSDDSKEKLLAVLNSADFKRRYKGSWIWRRTD